MKLRELLAGAGVDRVCRATAEVEIAGLAYDSRRWGRGRSSSASPASKADGHEFAPQAVEAGAAALVVERQLGAGACRRSWSPTRGRRWRRSRRASTATRRRELRVVGVTGTNGKTTTAFLLRHILEAAGIQTGLLGTVKQVVGGVEEEVERTTPEAIDLQATFRAHARRRRPRLRDGGLLARAGAAPRRRDPLRRCALFTNLTQDHLDFHGDMEDYFRAKRKLFEAGRGRAPRSSTSTTPTARRLAEEFECVDLLGRGRARPTTSPATSRFDAARRAVHRAGRPAWRSRSRRRCRATSTSTTRWARCGGGGARRRAGRAPRPRWRGRRRVPGRFEPVDEGQPFAVLVDYAHTPDSLENVLRAARRLTDGPADRRSSAPAATATATSAR